MINFASETTVKTMGKRTMAMMANGTAMAFTISWDLIIKKLFEKNSTVYSTITERRKVRAAIGTSTVSERGAKCDWYQERRQSVVKMPKSNSEAMFPISVVPINQVGLPIKKDMILAGKFLFPA